jgi:hypothetical protein
MKTIETFKAAALAIVERAHRIYPWAEGLRNAFTEFAYEILGGVATTPGTTYLWDIGVVPEAESDQGWQVAKLSLISPTTMAGSATLQETFVFGYSRAGAAIVPIGQFVTTVVVTAGTAGPLTAETETPVTVLAAGLSLLAGDVLTLSVTPTSTGTAVPAGAIAKVELQ